MAAFSRLLCNSAIPRILQPSWGNGDVSLSFFQKATGSKLLVVGAGGIGCELIKNLVMMGFNDIEMIDLDTIDVSNLNRQFLFRSKHVGKSKATKSLLKLAEGCVLIFACALRRP